MRTLPPSFSAAVFPGFAGRSPNAVRGPVFQDDRDGLLQADLSRQAFLNAATLQPVFGSKQKFSPTKHELQKIHHALTGWEGDGRVLAASCYATPKVLAGIRDLLALPLAVSEDGDPDRSTVASFVDEKIPRSLLEDLALAKARLLNTFTLLQGGLIQPSSSFEDEARSFLTDLKREMVITENQMRRVFQLNDAGVALYREFVAQTAPILFVMGFDDAIPHAGQVSRLCGYMTQRQQKSQGSTVEVINRPEILIALMVGWLHDPKLRGDISWSNLAAHPVVGSAIATHLLQADRMRHLYRNFADSFQTRPSGLRPGRFQRAVAEALAINNDSRFVVNNVILHKPPFPVPGVVEPGILDQIGQTKGLRIARRIEKLVDDRMSAPSRGEKPPMLKSSKALRALRTTRLETGLRGVSRDAWLRTVRDVKPELGPQQALDLFEQVIDGQLADKDLEAALAKNLRTRKDAVVACRISGSALLAHHGELSGWSRQAALALVNSDPLLLSAHKIGAVGTQIQSFVRSFNDNIRDLPKDCHERGVWWQRSVFLSILKAADRLNSTSLRRDFLLDTADLNIEVQVKRLGELLVKPEIWGRYAGVKKGDPDFDTALKALEDEYREMLPKYRLAALDENGSERFLTLD